MVREVHRLARLGVRFNEVEKNSVVVLMAPNLICLKASS